MGTIAITDEAHWHSVRESNIGGSEVSSLFYRWRNEAGDEVIRHMFETPVAGETLIGCMNPFRTGYRLWFEKSGLIQPDDLSGNERVQSGTFMEPALAEWAKFKWDWKLRKVRRYMTHATVEGWGASCDYEEVGPGMPPVEFKNIDGGVFRDAWTSDGEEIILPPMYYLLQVQHQLGASDADHGWIVACVSGNKLVRGRIPRHEPTQQRIAEAVTAFWMGVRAGAEPKWLADYESAAKVFSHAEKGKSIDLTENAELPSVCETYLAKKSQLESLESEVEMLKGQVAALLGEHSKATARGFRISWPVIERAEKEIPARIQKALTYRGALSISTVKEEA